MRPCIAAFVLWIIYFACFFWISSNPLGHRLGKEVTRTLITEYCWMISNHVDGDQDHCPAIFSCIDVHVCDSVSLPAAAVWEQSSIQRACGTGPGLWNHTVGRTSPRHAAIPRPLNSQRTHCDKKTSIVVSFEEECFQHFLRHRTRTAISQAGQCTQPNSKLVSGNRTHHCVLIHLFEDASKWPQD